MGNKVIEVNLEYGMPKVETAIANLKNALTTYKGQGYKSVIVIHGYGSSGTGGSIKAAVIKCLGDSSLRGIVKAYVNGEQWYMKKREFLSMCRDLENFENKISNNNGITVVVLR